MKEAEKTAEITIRRALPEELEAAMKIYRTLIGTEGCTWDEGYPDRETVLAGIKSGGLYFAELDGKIAACAFCGEDDEDLKSLSGWSGEIKNPCFFARIGVLPEYQGRKIASALLGFFLRTMPGAGFDGMHFLVSRTNFPALALYAKFGFENAGECEMFGEQWYMYERKA